MNINLTPGGLFVAEYPKATEPVPVVRKPDDAGNEPLPQLSDWYASLTDEQKNELLGFLPSVFLRAGGSGLGLDGQVSKLMARATRLSGKDFEVFT